MEINFKELVGRVYYSFGIKRYKVSNKVSNVPKGTTHWKCGMDSCYHKIDRDRIYFWHQPNKVWVEVDYEVDLKSFKKIIFQESNMKKLVIGIAMLGLVGCSYETVIEECINEN